MRAAAPSSSRRSELRATVGAIEAADATEHTHRADVLAWIDSDAPLYRTAKPATPPKHLVSYALLVDPDRFELLLIDHRLARLWLPTGGHVELGEEPFPAAARELTEELGVVAEPLPACGRAPFFLTVTQTVGSPLNGVESRHVDVSLWYAFLGSGEQAVEVDEREAHSARWWPMADVEHGVGDRFDPHLGRATAKLRRLMNSR